ncbi:hypothetical protein LNP18_06425 [Leuconostoc citreum]|uniref:hypothetical protein n=1 Tax=Leuconostoc citreum TaxID=33964 RepID=UPI00200A50E9|nr:hypothetical protein [Leuconostoc citreum]MCK8605739.1 hypothetical protein [Leuconostoc citreum]
MAKKTINTKIQEAQRHLDALDEQIKVIQDEKKAVRQEIKALNEQLVAELGRQLLDKLNLQDSNPNAISEAFAELDKLPINRKGEVEHGDY